MSAIVSGLQVSAALRYSEIRQRYGDIFGLGGCMTLLNTAVTQKVAWQTAMAVMNHQMSTIVGIKRTVA